MTTLHIEGRRWFQRSAGNTYHSVHIFQDGKQIAYFLIDPYSQHDEQIAVLEKDLADGLISQAEFDRAVALLERWLDDFDRIL